MLILSLQNHACRHVALNRGISTQKTTTIWGRPGFWFLMRSIEFHHKTCYACFSFETNVLINEAFYLYLRLLASFKTADRSSCRTTLGILNLKWLVVVSLYTFSTIFFILVSCNERKAVNSKYLNQRETNWQPVQDIHLQSWLEKERKNARLNKILACHQHSSLKLFFCFSFIFLEWEKRLNENRFQMNVFSFLPDRKKF